MKNKFDLIILVIANNSGYYKQFIDNYWYPFINYVNKNHNNIKIFLLFNNKEECKDLSDNCPVIINPNNKPETLIPGVLEKTFYGLKYIQKNFIYKHVLRTNMSSFFIIKKTLEISKNLPPDNVYAGVLSKKFNFISGAGFWMSCDTVQYILDNEENLNYNIIDDVAIGNLMKKKKKINLSRYDCPPLLIFNRSKIMDDIIKNKHYHIRMKQNTSSKYRSYKFYKKRRGDDDVILAKYLFKYFYCSEKK